MSKVGHAVLANGLLRGSSIELVDERPTDVLLADSTVRLRVERLDGAPLLGPYAGGWQPGTVEVRVLVEFEVTQFDPGAVLRLRNLTVR